MNTTASTRLEAESWSEWGRPSVPGSVKSGADEPEMRRAGPAVPQEAADRDAASAKTKRMMDVVKVTTSATQPRRHLRASLQPAVLPHHRKQPVNRQRVDAQIVRPRRRLRPEQGVGDRPFRRLCCCLEQR